MFCVTAIETLKMIPEEINILEFQEKLKMDPEKAKEYEEWKSKPVPKPQFTKLEVFSFVILETEFTSGSPRHASAS